MLKRFLLFCTVLLLAVPAGEAKLFENPETVSYLHAEVVKEGSITLESTGTGAMADRLEIRHSVPQETYRQSSEIKSVTGPDEYSIERDDFGNEVIVLTWNDPPLDQRIDYGLLFEVKVWDRDDPAGGLDFPVTPMTEASQEITEKAYELTGGLRSREKFMKLSSYIYDLVEYDSSYQNVQKSAEWVFKNRKAVCDGHANLLIAMLRALGYNAYYVIGYAYTEENIDPEQPNYWGPHGWVEVEHDGRAVSLDPTWLQHPVDATHIKFALVPDSNYTEYVEILANNVRVNWEKGDYVVSMLDTEERPRIDIEGMLVPESVGSEQHSLLITHIRSSTDESCILTRIRLNSCTENGRPFLTMLPGERSVGFCENETLYWILGTPELQPGVEYTCGVNIYGAGRRSSTTLKAAMGADFIGTRLSTVKVLTPSQFFQANTTVENTGLGGSELELFMMLGDSVQSKRLSLDAMQAADLVWTMRAPRLPGAYTLRFFSSSGDLLEEGVQVIEKRSVEIAGVPIPVNMSIEESLHLNITIRGLERTMGLLRLTIGGEVFEREFIIDKGEEKTLTFIYSPDKEGVKHISVVVLSGHEDYEDGLTASVTVIREREWWEPLWEVIRGLLEGLFSLLGMNS
jgi:transglutaminase-like putative cysteine protease